MMLTLFGHTVPLHGRIRGAITFASWEQDILSVKAFYSGRGTRHANFIMKSDMIEQFLNTNTNPVFVA